MAENYFNVCAQLGGKSIPISEASLPPSDIFREMAQGMLALTRGLAALGAKVDALVAATGAVQVPTAAAGATEPSQTVGHAAKLEHTLGVLKEQLGPPT